MARLLASGRPLPLAAAAAAAARRRGRRRLGAAAGGGSADAYEVLGVPRDASPEDVKAAYAPGEGGGPSAPRAEGGGEALRRRGGGLRGVVRSRRGAAPSTAAAAEAPRVASVAPAPPTAAAASLASTPAARLLRQRPGASSGTSSTAPPWASRRTGPALRQRRRWRARGRLPVGSEVRVLSDRAAVLGACRACGLDASRDELRVRALGRPAVGVDAGDRTAKVRLDGAAGDVWLAARALVGVGRRGAAGTPRGGAGTVQMKQDVVSLPDGRRAVRVTRTTRAHDGAVSEEVTEIPME
ncbi:unnamed protein product [Prorocentrum cordatum]|uniref:J domain-containing protein n=1 Tax=Prorocentrum cordatum TaxID=2364126 RepID=A0ABN9X424_9DINO|nr:unnamed protein product [Polarella glacialis]